MGGGAMVTPVAGAVGAGIRAGPPDPLTITTKTTTNLRSHHISSSSSHLNLPVSANCTAPLRPTTTNCSCLGETSTTPLESVDGREDKRASGLFNYDFVFGPVPSPIEVEKAISDLQSFMLGFCPSGSELEQMLYLYDPRMLQSLGYSRVYDAFRLLHTDPSVQVPSCTPTSGVFANSGIVCFGLGQSSFLSTVDNIESCSKRQF
uniref:Uncharacterized protein n=1 Tax=Davidia involucrata TaxID=16924 RepID=A0A5B7BWX2_DAVIN